MQNVLLILVIITCFSKSILDIKKPQVAVSTTEYNYLYQGIDNPVTIVARQNQAVQANQITAEIDVYDDSNEVFYAQVKGKNGEFLIKPKQDGQLTLKVKTRDGVWEKKYHVRPIQATAKIGNLNKGSMPDGVFKAQGGVIPVLECCGFDARCDIVEYSIIKISKEGIVQRAKNTGGRFNDPIRPLIDSAQPGDIYWFRKILCRCPGDTTVHETSDISIDIE